MQRILWACPLVLLAAVAVGLSRPRIHRAVGHYLYTHSRYLPPNRYTADMIEFPPARWLFSYDAKISIYQADNRALPAFAPGRIVFFGDSLFQLWATLYPSQFFPGKPYLNRGIGGEKTSGLIWRFHQDVVDLHPQAVVLLAGTNDVAFHHLTEAQIEGNLQAMVQVAKRYGIHVVICSLPPMSPAAPAWTPYTDPEIRNLNAWLRQYATQQHLAFADFYTVLADPAGHMPASLSPDGIHPNLAGYTLMQPVAQQALDSLPAPR